MRRPIFYGFGKKVGSRYVAASGIRTFRGIPGASKRGGRGGAEPPKDVDKKAMREKADKLDKDDKEPKGERKVKQTKEDRIFLDEVEHSDQMSDRERLEMLVGLTEYRGQFGMAWMPSDKLRNTDVTFIREVLNMETRKEGFIVSEYPNCRTRSVNVPNLNALDKFWVKFDCMGSPFCGMVAVDTACKHPRKFEDYLKYYRDFGENVFRPEFLGWYGNVRGVNIQVITRNRVIYCNVNNMSWEMVNLYFEPDDLDQDQPKYTNVGNELEAGICFGHYLLMIKHEQNAVPKEVTGYKPIRGSPPKPTWKDRLVVGLWVWLIIFVCGNIGFSIGWSTGFEDLGVAVFFLCSLSLWLIFSIKRSFSLVEILVRRHDGDVRTMRDMRDPLKHQDRVLKFRCDVDVHMFGVLVFVFRPFWWFKQELNVSERLFSDCMNEAQRLFSSGFDPNKALATHVNVPGLNISSDFAYLINDTAELARCCISYFGTPVIVAKPENYRVYNVNNGESILPSEEVREMQIMGKGNHVVKYRLKPPTRRIVAESVGLGFHTDEGLVHPGLISVTDSPGVLTAFTGRSMPKPRGDYLKKLRFVEEAIVNSDWLVDTVDLEGLTESDDWVDFENIVRKQGSKTAAQIDSIKVQYEKHIKNLLRPNDKFYQHSAFCKEEDNGKETPDGYFVKPRLIMTMSQEMAIECVRVLWLIDRWNHSCFSNFQVKDITPAEMIKRVLEISEFDHNVTDYSSFESSITEDVREIELHVLTKLCERAKMFKTLRALHKHAFGPRRLVTRWGTFEISSRCSGDYWTSFGNGLVNYMIMCYSNGWKIPRVLVEGDDGLTEAGTSNSHKILEIGFSFSSSLSGGKPGDCDFLRSRWIDGRRYLNVGRVIKNFWVKRCSELSMGKKLFLLRCMANSLHHLSPGHPILTSLVKVVLKKTAGVNEFKNWESYLNRWKNLDYSRVDYRQLQVDESMRSAISDGAVGFPPISVAAQLFLEQEIEGSEGFCYLGCILSGYDEIRVNSRQYIKPEDVERYANSAKLVDYFNDFNGSVDVSESGVVTGGGLGSTVPDYANGVSPPKR